jgi:hypothetical protein
MDLLTQPQNDLDQEDYLGNAGHDGRSRSLRRLNVERFCKMFSEEVDEAKRQTLANLISEEKAKLDRIVGTHFT